MLSREWSNLPDDTKARIVELQSSAPVKLAPIAEALGLRVRSSTLPAGISGEIRPAMDEPGHFIIRVNRHDSEARQRFTVAHELAHYLLHREHIGSGVTDDVLYRSVLSNFREAQANRLAAEILMPKHLVDKALEDAKALGVEDIPNHLAREFGVSDAAMKIRLGLT